MVMGNNNNIDLWQILQVRGRVHISPGAGKWQGRTAVTPDRIGENVQPLYLYKQGGVANPSDGQVGFALFKETAIIINNFETIFFGFFRFFTF